MQSYLPINQSNKQVYPLPNPLYVGIKCTPYPPLMSMLLFFMAILPIRNCLPKTTFPNFTVDDPPLPPSFTYK